jgi:hypothetical protein
VLRSTSGSELTGHVSFRNATVTGMYPTIQVEAAPNGFRFEGEFQDERTLLEHWRTSSSGTPSPMSLERGAVPTAGCL